MVSKLDRLDPGAVVDRMMFGGHGSRLATVTHGDFWSNNMMFRDGEPAEVKLLDFQMSLLAHPANDIAYFLYVNTDRAFREANLDKCLRWYYDAFSKYFTGIMDDYGFQDFEEEFQRHRIGGAMWGLGVIN